ncbi:DgyrCDS11933 [Dimorphilus gyrociliatus]|uniref:DgyrCDS11933 n=1 Tax=Dimorphilus gyrociliatus TaxID=2664684 RepID=A0A7I8W6S6_9ANNE|nr:DgyrCDS11933 [Dimorphilus gyrociliatus]
MSGWCSLAGYLTYKAPGALGKLRGKRRQWFILDEKNTVLTFYKSEDEASLNKEPQGTIDVKNVAICTSADNSNQFIIVCDNKEHILTADNHESMMIWLVRIQAQKNRHSSSSSSNSNRSPYRNARSEDDADTTPFQDCRRRSEADIRLPRPLSDNIRRISTLISAPKGFDKDIDEVFSDRPHRKRKTGQDNLTPFSASQRSADSVFDSTQGTTPATNSPDSDFECRMADLEEELMDVKQAHKEALERENSYKLTLQRRDAVILEQDEKIGKLQEQVIKLEQRNRTPTNKNEEMRILRNQNNFLNAEIKRLTRLRVNEREASGSKDSRLYELENEIEQWKRDYVLLLQSCITVPTGDISDGVSVNLYGGDLHKNRVKQLLAEARSHNPSLPTFDKMASAALHVDGYGFKHSHSNEGLLLHYICTQLHQFYSATDLEVMHSDWKEVIASGPEALRQGTFILKRLVRSGVPAVMRPAVWKALIRSKVSNELEEKGLHYYDNLVSISRENEQVAKHRKQIALDLLRTMPSNVHFDSPNTDGIAKLHDVLMAFCLHRPETGYCQGMNFIAATALLLLDPHDAFWTLVAITEKCFSEDYFDSSLTGAQVDQEVLKELIAEKLPHLHNHLRRLDIDLTTITLNWFLAVFIDAVPFECQLRIWDCFLCEGPKVLFRFAVALLSMHGDGLLQRQDTISVMRYLKAVAKLTYDVDGLLHTAFNKLAPFPRRADITDRQKRQSKKLKAEMQRARAQCEKVLRVESFEGKALPLISCPIDNKQVLICFVKEDTSILYRADISLLLLHRLDIKIDGRVTCALSIQTGCIVLATVSKRFYKLHIDGEDCKIVWSCNLHAVMLCMAVHLEDDDCCRLFTGMADGTVGVMDRLNESDDDCLYVPISRCAVSALCVASDHLWVACGATIHIVHLETLDPIDKITVASDLLDQVLSMSSTPAGVWMVVRGSSLIQLWSPTNYTCLLQYETREGSNRLEEDETALNPTRITSMLTGRNGIWLGTANGQVMALDLISSVILTPPINNDSTSLDLGSASVSHLLEIPAGDFRSSTSSLASTTSLKDVTYDLKLIFRSKVSDNVVRCIVALSSPSDIKVVTAAGDVETDKNAVFVWGRKSNEEDDWLRESVQLASKVPDINFRSPCLQVQCNDKESSNMIQ